MQEEENELIDLKRAAEIAEVDPSTLRRAAIAETLTAKKVGRDWLVKPKDLKAWQDNPDLHKTGKKAQK